MNKQEKYLKAVDLLKRWRVIINGRGRISPEFLAETLKQQNNLLTEAEGFDCEYFSDFEDTELFL